MNVVIERKHIQPEQQLAIRSDYMSAK